MPNYIYLDMLHKLVNMDEKQLIELLHDLDSLPTVDRLYKATWQFLREFGWKTEQERDKDYDDWRARPSNKPSMHALDASHYLGQANPTTSYSEFKEWEDRDNAQRYRDIKSTNERLY
jgi:hypothetical protein